VSSIKTTTPPMLEQIELNLEENEEKKENINDELVAVEDTDDNLVTLRTSFRPGQVQKRRFCGVCFFQIFSKGLG